MKFSKFILSLLFVISAHVLYSQTRLNEYALVSVSQSLYPDVSYINITYEDGKQTKIDLPKMESFQKKDLFINSQNATDAQILKTLNEMVERGYKIISVHTPISISGGVVYTVYTMEKLN